MTTSVYLLIGYTFAIRFLFGETLTVVMQTGVAINTFFCECAHGLHNNKHDTI